MMNAVYKTTKGNLMKFKKRIESTLHALRELEEDIDEFMKKNNIPDEDIYFIKLSVHEAILNILEHTYRWCPQNYIDIVMDIEGQNLEIRIRDYGPAVPESVKNLMNPSKSYIGGLGMKFMKTFLSQIYYEDTDKGNELVMKKIIDRINN